MKVGLGKIGQTIYFNRDDLHVKRSNTNGNVGTYNLIKLLADNNTQSDFYMLSKNDITFCDGINVNLHDYSAMSVDDLNKRNLDVMFIFTGLAEYENDERFIEILNNTKVPIILLCDDPRCLKSIDESDKFNFLPIRIFAQNEFGMFFNNTYYEIEYMPLQTASCYNQNIESFTEKFEIKTKDLIAIANTAGSYKRLDILKDLIEDIDGVEIYGRLSENENNMFDDKHKGEVDFDEIEDILDHTKMSIAIPIEKDWVTSKYIELLMHGVLPIFYKDYNVKLLHCDRKLNVVSSNEELKNVIKFYNEHKELLIYDVVSLYCELVQPYTNGKALAHRLMTSASYSLIKNVDGEA